MTIIGAKRYPSYEGVMRSLTPAGIPPESAA
jgi:hypothetical protein